MIISNDNIGYSGSLVFKLSRNKDSITLKNSGTGNLFKLIVSALFYGELESENLPYAIDLLDSRGNTVLFNPIIIQRAQPEYADTYATLKYLASISHNNISTTLLNATDSLKLVLKSKGNNSVSPVILAEIVASELKESLTNLSSGINASLEWRLKFSNSGNSVSGLNFEDNTTGDDTGTSPNSDITNSENLEVN